MSRKIVVADRPYILTFHGSGQSYPLTSAEAQNLIDAYPSVTATRHRVILQGHNSSHASGRTTIRPATYGGGPAFIVTKGEDQR